MTPQTNDPSEPQPLYPDNTPPPAPVQPVPVTPPMPMAFQPANTSTPAAPAPLTTFDQPVAFDIPAHGPIGQFNPKPRHSRKKIVAIIAGAAVAVIGLGGYAAYALWYNAPQNVVADALGQVMMTKTGTAEGAFDMASSDDSSMKLDFKLAQAESRDASFNANFALKISGKTYTLKTSAVTTHDSTAYLKLENVREVLNSVMGLQGVPSDALKMFDGLINKIDGKWVVITPADLQQDPKATDQSKCAEKAFDTFQDNAKQRSEIIDAYKKNAFIIVSKNLGTEAVNGMTSNHYELTADDKKAQGFIGAVVKTTVFKAIDKCYDNELSKSYDANKSNSDSSTSNSDTAKVELWIDKWNHKPTKLKISDKAEPKNALQSTFNLGAKPSVTVPKADTTFTDLKTEIESLQNQLYGITPGEGVEITGTNEPVLGVQTFRNFPSWMPRL